MNAEINKRCPEVVMKKRTHIFGTPQKKHDLLVMACTPACMERVEAGGVATGTGQ